MLQELRKAQGGTEELAPLRKQLAESQQALLDVKQEHMDLDGKLLANAQDVLDFIIAPVHRELAHNTYSYSQYLNVPEHSPLPVCVQLLVAQAFHCKQP